MSLTVEEFNAVHARVDVNGPTTVQGELAALLSELTGYLVRRPLHQCDGEGHLEGLPGWSIGCKHHANATQALVAGWWRQAIKQAERICAEPVLFYRSDRGQWRAVWSASLLTHDGAELAPAHTLEADPTTWWALVQHLS